MTPERNRKTQRITLEKLNRASEQELAAHWFNRYDTLITMGFPTTAEIHDRRRAGVQSDPYHDNEERAVISDSILCMEAIIQEHKEPNT